jgi:F-box-like
MLFNPCFSTGFKLEAYVAGEVKASKFGSSESQRNEIARRVADSMSWDKLPVELILEIVSLLKNRIDLVNLRLLCRRTHNIVTPLVWKGCSKLTLECKEIIEFDSCLRGSSIFPNLFTSLTISMPPDTMIGDDTKEALHRVLRGLSTVQTLTIPTIDPFSCNLRSVCPLSLTKIKNLHLIGTNDIGPLEVLVCMVILPQLRELEASMNVERTLSTYIGADAKFESDVTHLKLWYWFKQSSPQSTILGLIRTPRRLQSLIIHHVSPDRRTAPDPGGTALLDHYALVFTKARASLTHFEVHDRELESTRPLTTLFSPSLFPSLKTLIVPGFF